MAYEAGIKRPRMDGGGFGVDYGMGGQIGSAYGGMMELPCVKLRGLPFDVTDGDICAFLGNPPILDLIKLRRDGRLTGEAFVLLNGPAAVDMALQKNRSYMGRRYIEVYKTRKIEYYRAVSSELNESCFQEGTRSAGAGGFGARNGGFQGGQDRSHHRGGDLGAGDVFGGQDGPGRYHGGGGGGGDHSHGTTILKLRGLPFSVSDEDICGWFNDDTNLGISQVVKENVLVVMEHGRPSGVAFVEFPTPSEATSALAKNRHMFGSRYIEIFPANRADLERASSTAR